MMTPIPEKADIAIVGGGMVGAALAALLSHAHKDWQIVLLEAFPFPEKGKPHFQPSFDDRSTALAQGSIELLDRIGVWQQLSEKSTPISQVHVSDKGHFGGSVIDAQKLGLDAVGGVVANAWLGQVLIQHLYNCENVSLIAPSSVSKIQPVVDGARLHVSCDGVETYLETALAVIADGAQSSLRESLGIDVEISRYYQTAIIANVVLKEPHQGVAYERFTDQGPMALLPLDGINGCKSALVWTQPEDQAEEILALSDEKFTALLQQRFGFRLGYFAGVGKRDAYPLQLMVAKEQVRSSIVVVGNAAHFLHPVAGQGFNLAVRDCAALVSELAQAWDHKTEPLGSLSVLQRYEQRQGADQQATIQFSDKLTRLFSSSALPAAALRALGFVGLEGLPIAKQLLASQTMGQATKRPILTR